MPRTGRVVVPNYPHHVVQRGHNRQTVFAETADYGYYLETLKEWKREYNIRVYGWCLMTNHVHLILEPPDDKRMGMLMKRLAGRQTRFVNCLEGRTGSLWEGRYKSSPIQTERYLLACIRYVELNPVNAGIVTKPEHYHWSSYRERMGVDFPGILDYDSVYLGLGDNHEQCRIAYSDYIQMDIPAGEKAIIGSALQRGQLTGDNKFIKEVEKIIGKRIEHKKRGRPERDAHK